MRVTLIFTSQEKSSLVKGGFNKESLRVGDDGEYFISNTT